MWLNGLWLVLLYIGSKKCLLQSSPRQNAAQERVLDENSISWKTKTDGTSYHQYCAIVNTMLLIAKLDPLNHEYVKHFLHNQTALLKGTFQYLDWMAIKQMNRFNLQAFHYCSDIHTHLFYFYNSV